MNCYSYDGRGSDFPRSEPSSGSDSEASSAQPQRFLVIFLDSDEGEEVEEPAHPLPSYRPKRPLPKNFGKKHHSPMKEDTVQEMGMPRAEVYHTISCTPGLRDKSLEVRLFLSHAISHAKPCHRNSEWNVIVRARLPRGNLPSQLAVEWGESLPVFYPGANQKEIL